MASVDTPSQPPPSTIDSASANNIPSSANDGAGERASVLAPGTVGVQRTTLDSSGVPGAAPGEGQAEVRCELEGFKRCSDSHLWKLMMSFYDRKGIDSWSQGVVPHFITCNAFIGRSYAKVLQGFLRDCASGRLNLDPSEPLYIVELGVGSGKFSFYMLKALEEMKDTIDFPVEKIVYVLTDFTDANVNYWAEHPQLKQYFDSGQMDCAIFDAVNDSNITLAKSGKVLAPGSVKNPLCVVANYLFDTLCHDIFQVAPAPLPTKHADGSSPGPYLPGILKEGLISVGSKKAEEPDPLEPEIIKRLDNRYRYDEINDDYYTKLEGGHDALHFQRILHWYRDYFAGNPIPAPPDGSGSASSNGNFSNGNAASAMAGDRSGASILIPIGALRAVRRLAALSSSRCLVISGDKGNNNPDQFRGLMDPHIAVHGSFSVMVNYHAIGAYFTSRGGFALHNPQEEASLKVSAFVLPGDTEEDASNGSKSSKSSKMTAEEADKASGIEGWTGNSLEARDARRMARFPHLCAAFAREVEQFGPNDFFVMQKALKEDAPTPTLKAVVALLKLADWDPDVFYKFRDVILNQVPSHGHKLRNDLCRGVPRVWCNHYTLDKDKDVAFEIGRFYYGIRDYQHALQYYRTSSSTVGQHHVTSHNMGLCYYSMGEFAQSLTCFEEALGLNAAYEKAASWRDKVLQELANAKANAAPAPPMVTSVVVEEGESSADE